MPSLLHASDDYTKEEVIKIISNGKQPPLEDHYEASAAVVHAVLENCAQQRGHQPDCGLSLVSADEEGGLVGIPAHSRWRAWLAGLWWQT